MGPAILLTLLLGAIRLVHGQDTGFGTFVRPEYPAHPDQGCKPGAVTTTSCPARMECFTNKNFPKGGRCDCNPLWYKVPGKLPFDDNEWDDGFSTADCDNHVLARIIVGSWHFFTAVMGATLVYSSVLVIVELIKVKALRWNASSTCLFFVTALALLEGTVGAIFCINTWGLDKTEFWYSLRNFMYTCQFPLVNFLNYEIGVTWIDLYDRNKKMSKSSSRNLKFMRWGLRAWALFMSFMYPTLSIGGGITALYISTLGPYFLNILFISTGGYLITNTLCKDRKDASNSNWKLSEAIRRAVKHDVQGHLMMVACLFGLLFTRGNPKTYYLYGLFNWVNHHFFMNTKYGWFQYLLLCNRKHLKKYARVPSSPYFGFATAGLNKMLFPTESSAYADRSTRTAVSTTHAVSSVDKKS